MLYFRSHCPKLKPTGISINRSESYKERIHQKVCITNLVKLNLLFLLLFVIYLQGI